MISFKEDVSIFGTKAEIVLAILVAERIYEKYGIELVVTSLCDGTHSETSLHYAGFAVDLRTWNIEPTEEHPALVPQIIADEIREALTADYDVVLESNHVHIEFQPRRKS